MSFGIAIKMAERGWIPDALLRVGIRRICADRLSEPNDKASEVALLNELSAGPIATHTGEANDQHYEVPPGYFVHTLGKRLKYSCALFDLPGADLNAAEESMMALYLQRGQLQGKQRILELGCGWGSFTLYMAEQLPEAEIVAVSNSAPQREFIEAKAKAAGLTNVRVITANMLDFDPADHGEVAPFDRCVSIEMFEHMNNYAELLRRVSGWLKPEGLLFVHIFCHKSRFYKYETNGAKNWMAQHFFTGGTMPSFDLLSRFNGDMEQQDSWWINGNHYEDTANAWLQNMDDQRSSLMPIFEQHYGKDAAVWWQRWRLFHLAVAELFGYDQGNEWGVGHFLMAPVGK